VLDYAYIPLEFIVWGPAFNPVHKGSYLLHHAVCTEDCTSKYDQMVRIHHQVMS